MGVHKLDLLAHVPSSCQVDGTFLHPGSSIISHREAVLRRSEQYPRHQKLSHCSQLLKFALHHPTDSTISLGDIKPLLLSPRSSSYSISPYHTPFRMLMSSKLHSQSQQLPPSASHLHSTLYTSLTTLDSTLSLTTSLV